MTIQDMLSGKSISCVTCELCYSSFKFDEKLHEHISGDLADDVGRDVIRAVVEGTRRIQAAYGAPVDVEWCWDGSSVWWVQVREISALQDAKIYSNRISREVLPNAFMPLLTDFGLRLVFIILFISTLSFLGLGIQPGGLELQ